jgi:hypothetical protein
VLPSPNPRDPELEGISLDELRGAAIFIIMRNRAMSNVDESALFYVYRVLQNFGKMAGAEKVLQVQLQKEYGQPFERLLQALDAGKPPAPPDVSPQDVDTALCYLKRLGRFEPELEDYKPGFEGKKTTNVGVQVKPSRSILVCVRLTSLSFEVGPKKDLTVIVKWPEDATCPLVTVLPVPPSQPKKKGAKGQDLKGPNHSK